MTVYALWFHWQSDCGMQKNLLGIFRSKDHAYDKLLSYSSMTIKSSELKDHHTVEAIEVQ